MTKRTEYEILAGLALILMTFGSTCSPIFPANPYCDANIYMTIGKGWLDGLLPYRDLYDQKGPVLYMLHALAAMISRTNFIGIWLLELVCCFFGLTAILKTLRLWMDERAAFPVAITFGCLIYCSMLMCFGDTVEEFSLPILMGSMYLFYRYAKRNEMPSWKESLLIGIGAGLIFWSKFTIAATYAGAGLAALILAIHRHESKALWQQIGWAALGFSGVTAVVLVIFACYGAIGELMKGYLFFNLFHYNAGDEGAGQELWGGYMIVYAVVFALLWLVPESKSMRLMLVLSLATTGILLVTVFCYYYYYLIFYAFLPLVGILLRWVKPGKATWIVCLLIAAIRFGTGYNVRLLAENRATSFAQPMAEWIRENDGRNNPAILTYDWLGPAIYVQAQCTPRIRYFFTPNSTYPEIMQMQNDYLHSRLADYVVTPDSLPESLGYRCVMTTIDYDRGVGADMFMHRETCTPIHLYQRCGCSNPPIRQTNM